MYWVGLFFGGVLEDRVGATPLEAVRAGASSGEDPGRACRKPVDPAGAASRGSPLHKRWFLQGDCEGSAQGLERNDYFGY